MFTFNPLHVAALLTLAILPAQAQTGSKAYTTGQTITSASPVAIAWNSNAFDLNGVHSTSVNNSRFTAPSSGLYLFSACIKAEDDSGGPTPVKLWLNGSTLQATFAISLIDGPSNRVQTSCFGVPVQLTSGDYVELLTSTQNTQLVISGGTQDVSWASLVKL